MTESIPPDLMDLENLNKTSQNKPAVRSPANALRRDDYRCRSHLSPSDGLVPRSFMNDEYLATQPTRGRQKPIVGRAMPASIDDRARSRQKFVSHDLTAVQNRLFGNKKSRLRVAPADSCAASERIKVLLTKKSLPNG